MRCSRPPSSYKACRCHSEKTIIPTDGTTIVKRPYRVTPIAAAARAVRRARRMTQAELAASAGITRGSVIRFESGAKGHLGTLQRIVGALGFTLPNDLLAAAAKLEAPAPTPVSEPAPAPPPPRRGR